MNDMKRLLSYAGPYKRDMIFGSALRTAISLTFTARESRWESARSVRL